MARLLVLGLVVTACAGVTSSPSTLSPDEFDRWCEAFENYHVARVSFWSMDPRDDGAKELEAEWLRWRQEVFALDPPPPLEGKFPWPVPRTREELELQPRSENEVLAWVDEHCGVLLPRMGMPASDA